MVDVALNELDIGNAGLGYLNTAYGVGALAGAFLTAGLAGKRRLSSPFVVGALLCGAPVLIAAFPNTGAALVAMALLGIGNPLVDVPCFTILQRAVPQAILGRAFGALSLIWLSSIGIGAIVVPLLLHVMSLRATLVVVGAFVPVLVVIFWRPLFDIDAKAVAPAGDLIELLRRTPIFAPLPSGSLETLVTRLIPVPAPAGETIITEGEAGDRFYVIADGQVEVTAAGRHVNTLGPGDYVGEIALIRDVPRTATVTATQPTQLYALERDDFLTAVTGHSGSRTAAEAEITARLTGLEAASGSLSALRTSEADSLSATLSASSRTSNWLRGIAFRTRS